MSDNVIRMADVKSDVQSLLMTQRRDGEVISEQLNTRNLHNHCLDGVRRRSSIGRRTARQTTLPRSWL